MPGRRLNLFTALRMTLSPLLSTQTLGPIAVPWLSSDAAPSLLYWAIRVHFLS